MCVGKMTSLSVPCFFLVRLVPGESKRGMALHPCEETPVLVYLPAALFGGR